MTAAVLLLAFASFEPRLADFSVHRGAETVTISPAKASATVIVFVSTICPVSDQYVERLNALYRTYKPEHVQFVITNPNANETWVDTIAYARRNGAEYTMYRDDNNRLADAVGAQSTPEAFVFDRMGRLRYRGHIDDATNPARVRTHSLHDAIASVLAGREVAVPKTRVLGCAIHRVTRPGR
jgi:hypothetical protein